MTIIRHKFKTHVGPYKWNDCRKSIQTLSAQYPETQGNINLDRYEVITKGDYSLPIRIKIHADSKNPNLIKNGEHKIIVTQDIVRKAGRNTYKETFDNALGKIYAHFSKKEKMANLAATLNTKQKPKALSLSETLTYVKKVLSKPTIL